MSMSEKDRVVIFDTTLRDGEQSPGATMTHEEKLEVAELLDQMGVDVVEGHRGDPPPGVRLATARPRAEMAERRRAARTPADRG